MTSGFVYESAEEAEKALKKRGIDTYYSRYGNPTVECFRGKMASLEEAEKCWATSSGMAALFAILMSYLEKGTEWLQEELLFGSCHYILTRILPNFGIDVELVDGSRFNSMGQGFEEKTKTSFFETPSNPCLEIVDIKGIRTSSSSWCVSCVDNVFATPILQKPIALGA